jgi:hypothetical protein
VLKRRYERLQELDGEWERPDDFRLVRVPITDPASERGSTFDSPELNNFTHIANNC